MSGDARVGFVEAMRALYGHLPDETRTLHAAFSAHYAWLNRRAAQRARFRSYRKNYLVPPLAPF